MEISALNNIRNIRNGFNFTKLFVNNAVVNIFSANYLNNKTVDSILSNRNLLNLIVNGTVKFEKGVLIKKTLNNVKINEESMKKIRSTELTGKDFLKYLSNKFVLSQKHFSDKSTIIVNQLFLDGLINGRSLSEINEEFLKIDGEQKLNANVTIKNLYVKNLQQTPHPLLQDIVLVNQGTFKIHQDVVFKKDLILNNFVVNERLNQINVFNGKLDVLLNNSTDVQLVTGNKEFQNVIVLNPVQLYAKINNGTRNPVLMIDEEVEVNEDVEILGNVKVEKYLEVLDVKSREEKSFGYLKEYGLKLLDEKISSNLEFIQQLNVNANNSDYKLWIKIFFR